MRYPVEENVYNICIHGIHHGLWTPNEGIKHRHLKNRADVADKICFGHTLKFESGSEFSAVQ